MGFFTPVPAKPSEEEIKKQKEKGKVVHARCEGRGKVNIGGNITDCKGEGGCNGKGFV